MVYVRWLRYLFFATIFSAPVPASCSGDENGVSDTEFVKQALDEHRDRIMSQPGVVGTGLSLCDGKPCIKVLVVRRTPELRRALEQILPSQPVIIEESGPIRSRPDEN